MGFQAAYLPRTRDMKHQVRVLEGNINRPSLMLRMYSEIRELNSMSG